MHIVAQQWIPLYTSILPVNHFLTNTPYKVIQYFEVNNLHINLNKTNFTVCQTRRNKLVSELKIKNGKEEINEVETTNFLGIDIDSNLT
jgi:hypothetical protein